MTKEWAEGFMKELKKRMQTYTEENLLQQDEASGMWYLQTFFSVYPDHSVNVMIQSMVFELRENVPQIEVVVNLTNDVKPGAGTEVMKAVNELNYLSPVGAFGMREKTGRLFLRNCWPLDPQKPFQELAKDTETYYGMMMEAVQGGYEGLSKIWNGEMDYEQAVKEGLLNRAAE